MAGIFWKVEWRKLFQKGPFHITTATRTTTANTATTAIITATNITITNTDVDIT